MRLAKFVSEDNFLLPNIIMGQLYFTPPKNFNDPYEGAFRRQVPTDRKSFSEWHSKHFSSRNIETDFNNILAFEKDVVQKGQNYMQENNGVCCFSSEEKKTDILMWAHYGSDHQGVCFIFDIDSKDDFYQNDSHRVIYGPEEVKYITEYLDERVDSENRFMSKDFWTSKFKIWSSESEFRFLASQYGPYFYKKSCLKEIIFGYRMDQFLQETVMFYVKNDSEYQTIKFHRIERASGMFEFALECLVPK